MDWSFRSLLFGLGVVVLWTAAAAEAAIEVAYDGANRPSSITGLDVQGSLYDVSISYGQSYSELFPSAVDSGSLPAFSKSQDGSSAAAAAITAAIQDSPPSAYPGFFLVSVAPFQRLDLGGEDWVWSSGTAYWDDPFWMWMNFLTCQPVSHQDPNWGWATFTPATLASLAVPEPASFAVWTLLGGFVLSAACRRQRQRA